MTPPDPRSSGSAWRSPQRSPRGATDSGPAAPKKDRREILEEVMKLPGGDKVLECIQCGLCAGGCPTRFAMDCSPIQIMKMITLGMREEVLSSSTIWECST